MAYLLDDGFDSWPEIARAGTAAAGLYVRCGSWIARNLANGRITDAIVPADVAGMYGTVEWRQRLVDVGLWANEGMGYRDLRYFDLNMTAAQAADRRQKRAAAGRKGGLARKNKQVPSNGQASASRLLPPQSPLLPPSGEGGTARPRTREARRAVDDLNPSWFDDPHERAAYHAELQEVAEANVHAIVDLQQRTARGAALAREAIKPPKPKPPRRGFGDLVAATELPEPPAQEGP